MNLKQILLMHGYGVYVWVSYAITLGIFGFNLFKSLQEKRKILKMIERTNES